MLLFRSAGAAQDQFNRGRTLPGGGGSIRSGGERRTLSPTGMNEIATAGIGGAIDTPSSSIPRVRTALSVPASQTQSSPDDSAGCPMHTGADAVNSFSWQFHPTTTSAHAHARNGDAWNNTASSIRMEIARLIRVGV
jgi:hypothetical protein